MTNQETFGVEFPRSLVQNKYSGKITLNLFQGTSVVGTVFSDAETQLGALNAPSGLNPLTYAGRRDVGGPDYAARLNQLFGSFAIFTFQYGQHKDRYRLTPDGYARPAILDYTVSPTGAFFTRDILPGNPGYPPGYGTVAGPTQNNESRRQSYGGTFTAYLGNHELKVGGDYQNDETSGSTFFSSGSRLRVRPCRNDSQNPGDSSFCDLSQAPFWTNVNGDTHQVFFQHDIFAAGIREDYQLIDASPFDVPTRRYAAFLQDQWRVIPSLTINLGLRYDTESFYGLDPDPAIGRFKAFSLTNQWAPRIGVVWDFLGDGTSKLYASAGRFYYSLPTDLNVRVFTAASSVQTFNYSADSIVQDLAAPRGENFQGGSASGEPIDAGIRASYQDELTLGVEKAIDPTMSVGLKGTYRTLGRTLEDRCDLDSEDPLARDSTCALINPGSNGLASSGGILTCDNSGDPTDPTAGECGLPGRPVGDARRIFRGIELVARKQFSNQLWAQMSFLYSSLKGNYAGAIKEATGQTDPGINADFDYYQFAEKAYGNLELDRPVQARLDAVYNAAFGLTFGAGFYVRSGVPLSRLGWFNDFYTADLYLDTRGTDGRTPTVYDMNLSVGYNWNAGPVTITPMLFAYNVINRQTVVFLDQRYNIAGNFVTNAESPYYGQAGVEPGTGTCPATATAPCPDNPDYRKALGRTPPRLLRAALKITF